MEHYWKIRAISQLRGYKALLAEIDNAPGEIEELKQQMTALKSPGADGGESHGGGGRSSDRLDSLIDEITDREEALKAAKASAKRTRRALEALSQEDLVVLSAFYIEDMRNPTDYLMDRLYISRRTVYVRRDLALAKFRIARNGL